MADGDTPLSTPDASSLPAAGQPPAGVLTGGQPLTAQPPTQQDPHTSFVGKAFKHITNALEGTQTVYTPDPATGDIKSVPVPRKPGGIFRDILAGVLTGSAAAASADNKFKSGFAGIGLGGQAVMQDKLRMDSRAKLRAQESAQKQKEAFDANKAKQDLDMQVASATAAGTMSSLDYGHNVGHMRPEQIDSYNKSQGVVLTHLLNNGAVKPSIPGPDGSDLNGKPGNGPDVLAAVNKDPDLMKAGGDGLHRVPSITYDTSGLKFVSGKGYTNADGSPLDDEEWNKRATVTLVDIPNTAWGKNVTLTKGTFNDVAGAKLFQGNDTDTASGTIGSLYSLGLKNTEQMNKERAEVNTGPKDENQKKQRDTEIARIRAAQKAGTATPAEIHKADTWQPMNDAWEEKDKPVTPEQDKIITRQLNEKLKAGTIQPAERQDLIGRQQEAKLQGIPAEITAQVGKPPVPAQFPKGEDDPAYQNLNAMWGKNAQKLKTQESTAGAQIRVSAFGEVPYNVVDTNTGNMAVMTRDELAQANKGNSGRYLLATQEGTKIMGKQAAVKDIEYNIGNTEKSLDALDNMSPETRVKLAVALRSPDPHSALQTLMTSEAKAFSDPKLQDAVIALTSLSENVMLLRSVQGVGGAGSDMMREALVNLVPSGATPSKGYAKKQLEVLKGTLDRIKTGIPSTGTGGTNKPAAVPEGVAHKVIVDGKVVGITKDGGKTMTPVSQ